MTWFKVDDSLHSHVKAMRAGEAALGLWVLAGSWCADQLTDGWIPAYVAQRLTPNADALAADLVRAGLWVVDERDGETGWCFHSWEEYQPTRESVETRRKADTERRARWRDAKKTEGSQEESRHASRRDTPRDSHTESRQASALPVPTRPDPDTSKDVSPPCSPPSGDTRRTRAAVEPDRFAEFYDAYPKHKDRKAAAKAFGKALRDGVEPDTLIEAAWRYRCEMSGKEARYVKHPSTWLNKGCWHDEPDPAPTPARTLSTRDQRFLDAQRLKQTPPGDDITRTLRAIS